MNARELFYEDGKTSGLWRCSKCYRVTAGKTMAVDCCDLITCVTCGKKVHEPHHFMCTMCREEKEAREDMERLKKAEEVNISDLPVCTIFQCDFNSYNEGFGTYEDVLEGIAENMLDYEPEDRPTFFILWLARVSPLVQLDTSFVGDCISDNAWDEFCLSDLKGWDILEEAFDKFNRINEGMDLYEHSFKQYVRVPLSEVMEDYDEE